MKEGFSGVSCTLCRQPAGTASSGTRPRVSGVLALDTTAREARMVRPPRSRTPAAWWVVWGGG